MKTTHFFFSVGLALSASVAWAQSSSTFEFDIPNRTAPAVVAVPVPQARTESKPLKPVTPTSKSGPYNMTVQAKDPGDLCPTRAIAMTFTNLPNATGPHTNRWLSMGCTPDKASFMSEGDKTYRMEWDMHFNPSKDEYTLDWVWNGIGLHDESVRYHARHVFDLKVPRTLSLTNNISVTLRKVNP